MLQANKWLALTSEVATERDFTSIHDKWVESIDHVQFLSLLTECVLEYKNITQIRRKMRTVYKYCTIKTMRGIALQHGYVFTKVMVRDLRLPIQSYRLTVQDLDVMQVLFLLCVDELYMAWELGQSTGLKLAMKTEGSTKLKWAFAINQFVTMWRFIPTFEADEFIADAYDRHTNRLKPVFDTLVEEGYSVRVNPYTCVHTRTESNEQ